MRKVLILVFCCMTALFAWANDGVFFTEGTHLIPIAETDISVKKEVLTLNRVGEKIQVTVYYEFFNPADQKEVLVGFEAAAPDTYFNEQSVNNFPEHPYMSNFKVVLNGEPLSYEIAHVSQYDENWKYIPNPEYYVDGKIKSATPKELVLEEWLSHSEEAEAVGHPLYVYHFNALFRPGLNIIQHTYDFDISYERNGFTSEFYYILTAANRWANHQIDDFTLYVNMSDHTSFHISPRFFKSAEEWEIKGTGKYTIGTIPYQVKADSIFFHMQHGNIRFHKENFHPEGELLITFDYPWGLWSIVDQDYIESFNAESYIDSRKIQYEPFTMNYRSERRAIYNDLFTLEQRRILRNLPFAYRGYVFKTKELQDFYESSVWYIPNPEYNADVEGLSEDEQKWVEYWTLSDSIDNAKKKEIEDRVNSMYKHVFSEYLKPGHNPPLRYNYDTQYFSKDFFHLHDLISSLENQLGEPIIHDADHWICGQDWCDDLSARVLKVDMVSGKKAKVTVNVHNCNDHQLTLVMVCERQNWFIDDIIGNTSMRQGIIEEIESYRKQGLQPHNN